MSRIGNSPVAIPNGVSIDIEGSLVKISGGNDTLEFSLPPGIKINISDATLNAPRSKFVTESSDRKLPGCRVAWYSVLPLWGYLGITLRSLLAYEGDFGIILGQFCGKFGLRWGYFPYGDFGVALRLFWGLFWHMVHMAVGLVELKLKNVGNAIILEYFLKG